MNIIVKKNRFIVFGSYKLKCAIGKSGIKTFKKEGDSGTPKGTFNLGFLYYRKDKIGKLKVKIKKKIIKKNMGWCYDSRSSKYNKEILFPFKYKAEKLYRKDKIYDLFINIKYNTSPVLKKRGSAIFLHIANRNYRPTIGCVAISKKDFIKILPHINKNTKITIN